MHKADRAGLSEIYYLFIIKFMHISPALFTIIAGYLYNVINAFIRQASTNGQR